MILEVNHLHGWYTKKKPVIEDVHLRIEEGSICALLGANGAGKTTLLHILASIHSQYSGEIRYCGEKLTPGNSLRLKRHRYFIPDHPELFDEMPSIAFMELVHRLYGKRLDTDRLAELCAAFSFDAFLHRKIGALSLGNRQKTALINALLLQCPLLIMDEPLVGLDAVAIETFYRELRAYAAQGNAVLLSTHLFPIVDRLCDQAFILHQGTIEECVTISERRSVKERFFRVIGHD
ncbi:ABC transporter ATP-binding protein [Paenibacillus melissococcoides]|uniref:ABC transporter ATP-binding protein n=1 Tax=Paenibacillus melissococcoides TaxID=2912268 RepID=A0ABM9FYQ7_9BACL|nr:MULTISPECIES: ABC transporter ATP-binding protein [Paenibacillus]MEB9893416.1 ABC transporter ATP-binding protein [Bacillus cereus]CAH8244399.1 ABC transporter ATP-binding protein [Paenibacillus melissococcoides]CAH8703286.1 ABC transporter ATP-binding protein [Paenibacillus melissococcoides]CAH8705636.1 ABC transporter ATP-binding protein [Paenibacillus melissococcoides]GIO80800.1 putative ABC transporter ATP-binding protein AlbC [Paenibacillus dendritiformis]